MSTGAHAAGLVNVVVTNPDSQSGTLTNGYTYTAPPPAPTVTGISPTSGTTAGGTPVTITGTNFQTGATVSLGGTAATGVTVTPPNTINATTGAHAAGLVNVVVTNPDSQSGTLTNGYTYTAPPPAPTITSFSPTSGAVGASVTINGTNFTGATAVKFNGTSASFTVNTSIMITATVPAGATTGKISVTTPGGTATSANNFTVKHHASFTSDAAGVHLEARLTHSGGIDLMQTSETRDRLPVERIASLGSWWRNTDSLATGLTFSNIRFGSPWPAPGDSGVAAGMTAEVVLGLEEASGAVAGSVAVRPEAISTLGRRYSFYSPEMNLLAETEIKTTSGTPAVLYEYVWFNGHPVAQVDSGTTTHWTFTDHLGTPLIQTDSGGAVYWRAEHEPYGRVFSLRTGDQHQPLRLPGQEAEQLNLGLNGATERSYNIFRWFRPAWGRYTQSDPIGLEVPLARHMPADPLNVHTDSRVLPFLSEDPAHYFGGVNLYLYVQADPINLIDPIGLGPVIPFPGNPNPTVPNQNPSCKLLGYPPEWWDNAPNTPIMDPRRWGRGGGRAGVIGFLIGFDYYVWHDCVWKGTCTWLPFTPNWKPWGTMPHPPDTRLPDPNPKPCPKPEDCQ